MFVMNALLQPSQQHGRSPNCSSLTYKITFSIECLMAHIKSIWAITTMYTFVTYKVTVMFVVNVI
jgi:hypothetical protein